MCPNFRIFMVTCFRMKSWPVSWWSWGIEGVGRFSRGRNLKLGRQQLKPADCQNAVNKSRYPTLIDIVEPCIELDFNFYINSFLTPIIHITLLAKEFSGQEQQLKRQRWVINGLNLQNKLRIIFSKIKIHWLLLWTAKVNTCRQFND